MENSLMDLAPDIFAQTFTYTSNLAMGINITFITLYHHYREMIKEETVESEKREEFHKQKTFLLGFSHELKSLLNSVMGNLKLISLEHLSHKGRDLLLNVEVCSELLSHLVNNILDTGKVDINDLEINPSPHNIYDTLEKIWRVSSELIKRKDLEGRFRVQNNIPKGLKLDHARLTQIILNLIDNAVKFTEKGLIDISIEWINNKELVDKTCFEPFPFNEENDQDEGLFEKRQRLSILDSNTLFLNFSRKNFNHKMLENNSDTSKGILKVTITDTGRGISKKDIEKIFEKFSQISPSDSKEKLGTGLGLFITKELCLKMNGQVKGFSKEGKGSSFILCLPAEPTPEINSHLFKLESIKNIVEKKLFKALVVDDVPFNQLMMKEFLSRIGVEVVETAENGLDACNKFSDFAKKDISLNIITLDLDMPVMSGKLAAQKIREIEAENNMSPCLLIIVSGNCSESEISECLDPNNKIKANAFLKKPVSINELGRIVAEHRPSDNYKHFRKYNTM